MRTATTGTAARQFVSAGPLGPSDYKRTITRHCLISTLAEVDFRVLEREVFPRSRGGASAADLCSCRGRGEQGWAVRAWRSAGRCVSDACADGALSVPPLATAAALRGLPAVLASVTAAQTQRRLRRRSAGRSARLRHSMGRSAARRRQPVPARAPRLGWRVTCRPVPATRTGLLGAAYLAYEPHPWQAVDVAVASSLSGRSWGVDDVARLPDPGHALRHRPPLFTTAYPCWCLASARHLAVSSSAR